MKKILFIVFEIILEKNLFVLSCDLPFQKEKHDRFTAICPVNLMNSMEDIVVFLVLKGVTGNVW